MSVFSIDAAISVRGRTILAGVLVGDAREGDVLRHRGREVVIREVQDHRLLGGQYYPQTRRVALTVDGALSDYDPGTDWNVERPKVPQWARPSWASDPTFDYLADFRARAATWRFVVQDPTGHVRIVDTSS